MCLIGWDMLCKARQLIDSLEGVSADEKDDLKVVLAVVVESLWSEVLNPTLYRSIRIRNV